MRNSQRTISGMRIAIAEAGSGPPLLLIHGLGGSQIWQRMIAPLKDHFHVIVPDLPGFGESACPPSAFTTNDYAGFLGDLIDALDIAPVNIAGISYGGEITAVYSSANPQRVRRLILVASTGLYGSSWLARNDIRWHLFSAAAKHTFLRSERLMAFAGKRSFYDLRQRPPGLVENFVRQLSAAGKRESWLACARNISSDAKAFADALHDITTPTLILWGENDRVVPANYGSIMQQNIPGSTLKIFSGCGHSLPLEKPDEASKAISQFVHSTL